MPIDPWGAVVNPLSEYTGIAYDFRNYNCWHHVIKVREDNGIDTPEFDCTKPELSDSVFIQGHCDTKGMQQIGEPESLCAVLMCIDGRWHSGVHFDGMVSHCDMYARQVRLDSLESLKRLSERVEFWL